MAENGSHIKKYTAADIERYLRGSMSSAEMHQLEKAALDDPFLADALEGFAFTPTPAADAEELEMRLEKRISANKKRSLSFISGGNAGWLKIAAMVIILAGLGLLVYQTTGINKNELAKTTESLPPAVVKKDTASSTAPVEEKQQPQRNEDQIVKATLPKRKKSAARQSTTETKQEPVVAFGKDVPPAVVPSFRATAADSISVFKKESQPLARVASVPQKEVQNAAAANAFKGRVLDEKNNPIPNVSVAIKNKSIGTTTNQNGEFTLTAPDTTLNVTINSVGFETDEKKLNNNVENEIVLHPSNNALQEVVVVGYGQKKRRAEVSKSPITVKNGVPENGLEAFESYVLENVKKAKESNNIQETGEVKLSFTVDKNGVPQNIKLLQPLCKKCDAEAVRILKEGPKWKVQKKSKKATVTFRF